MSIIVPEWRYIGPPALCEKCGRKYSREDFESKHVDSETRLLDVMYRSWCKGCENVLMDESEKV